jgi:hypothetical protein
LKQVLGLDLEWQKIWKSLLVLDKKTCYAGSYSIFSLKFVEERKAELAQFEDGFPW